MASNIAAVLHSLLDQPPDRLGGRKEEPHLGLSLGQKLLILTQTLLGGWNPNPINAIAKSKYP